MSFAGDAQNIKEVKASQIEEVQGEQEAIRVAKMLKERERKARVAQEAAAATAAAAIREGEEEEPASARVLADRQSPAADSGRRTVSFRRGSQDAGSSRGNADSEEEEIFRQEERWESFKSAYASSSRPRSPPPQTPKRKASSIQAPTPKRFRESNQLSQPMCRRCFGALKEKVGPRGGAGLACNVSGGRKCRFCKKECVPVPPAFVADVNGVIEHRRLLNARGAGATEEDWQELAVRVADVSQLMINNTKAANKAGIVLPGTATQAPSKTGLAKLQLGVLRGIEAQLKTANALQAFSLGLVDQEFATDALKASQGVEEREDEAGDNNEEEQ